MRGRNGQLTFLDIISIISFLIDIENLELNATQDDMARIQRELSNKAELVLTGSEASWRKAENSSVFYRSADDYPMISGVICVCTHYAAQENVTSANNVNDNCVTFSRQQFSRYYIRDDSISTLDDFKTFLQQQYANGTPVTIWYVLATEETGTLNEPLRKIGDYADTIDSTQTSTQIPTTAGSTTISWAGQGLAPSQFDSIQEWVDILTYTYTNCEWVADN